MPGARVAYETFEEKKCQFFYLGPMGSLKKNHSFWSSRLASYSIHIYKYMSEELYYIEKSVIFSQVCI